MNKELLANFDLSIETTHFEQVTVQWFIPTLEGHEFLTKSPSTTCLSFDRFQRHKTEQHIPHVITGHALRIARRQKDVEQSRP